MSKADQDRAKILCILPPRSLVLVVSEDESYFLVHLTCSANHVAVVGITTILSGFSQAERCGVFVSFRISPLFHGESFGQFVLQTGFGQVGRVLLHLIFY